MAIAFFSTWTTYGTWLPGDDRCWYKKGQGLQVPDQIRLFAASLCMRESAVFLDKAERDVVEKTIRDHCRIRNWILHAVNCRSNHVHVVVTAPNRDIEIPREQFKAWCTRNLKAVSRKDRADWWTERGWDEYIDEEDELSEVVSYVLERQDRTH